MLFNIFFTTLFAQCLDIHSALEKVMNTQWKIQEEKDYVSLTDPENKSFEIITKPTDLQNLFSVTELLYKIDETKLDLSKWNFLLSDEDNSESYSSCCFFYSQDGQEVMLKYLQKKIPHTSLVLVK